MIYTSSYKCLPAVTSFALLRKARRLDPFLRTSIVVESEPAPVVCAKCNTDASPFWHKTSVSNGVSDPSKSVLCHQCHSGLETKFV